MIRERFLVYLINIFCPPLSVMLIAGLGIDCIINTLFFMAGVLPGHIHGFYITYTYFHRKRKVRKGIYPGGRKAMIYSEKVWNGGASNARVGELLEEQNRREYMEEEMRMQKRVSSRKSFVPSSSPRNIEMRQVEGWRV